jgi:N-acylneuraminate cytidylyltransferase
VTEAARVLGLIPARSGSKGLPGKNVRPLAGRPLIAYAVDAARRSGVIDRVVVTTDAPEIAAVAREAGAEVPFMRPTDLAGDDTPMLPVITHAVATLEASGWAADVVVLLQPTSPLRRPQTIAAAVEMLRQTQADSVVSVIQLPQHFSPDYVMRIEQGRLVPFLSEGSQITRRQDARPAYVRDGTVYCFWRRTLTEHNSIYGRDCRPLVIAEEESITIDTAGDWEEAERRIARVGAAG